MNVISTRMYDACAVAGQYVRMDGEDYYKISNSHLMPEFFVSLVSSSDHWMFISSNGALSAGRQNPDSSLFPYYSADKIVDMAACTGPKTIIRLPDNDGGGKLWEPFSALLAEHESISRNLYKNLLGNRFCLEEVNESAQLTFRYQWSLSHKFGFVRSCQLINTADRRQHVQVLDGLQNMLPHGLSRDFQLRYSNLGDAYKKNELLSESGIGLLYLSSIPTDRAEPSEGLRATVAWQHGLDSATVLLSSDQLDRFRRGQPVIEETSIRGRRGAYFVSTDEQLKPHSETCWEIVADLNYDHADIIQLRGQLVDSIDILSELKQDVSGGDRKLLAILSAADGRQLGADRLRIQRHQSNVLFNVMRGGIPLDGYRAESTDFRRHLRKFNGKVFARNKTFLDGLDANPRVDDLLQRAGQLDDPDLLRIALEYLPFIFSRRHGDPTRPWNAFSIDLMDPDGSETLCYEGNWRDIFQNWEALSLSFPDFCCSMIFRFVNASTADGYNPYRINKDGFDWEVIDPTDPWGNIGHWGDHQIIYLLKLLEWSKRFSPAHLDRWLSEECCTYAQVPYRIRSYADICRNPQETIDFDHQLAEAIDARVASLGADGKLLPNEDGNPYHVSLAEKLLVPALVKMTNFVPAGGVWLNTQRPEWNDANNALVGNGLSMVTACYLRRFFDFMIRWFSSGNLPTSVLVSREVVELLRGVSAVLTDHGEAFQGAVSDQQRKQIVDGLSIAGSQYRGRLYDDGLSGVKEDLPLSECVELFRRCLVMIDHSIRSNRRSDGLYHSYNLIVLDDAAYAVQPLYEMLEGQVAVLSSGLLTAEEAADVLDALRASRMYREDQDSYMLYPDRELPRFLEKNSVSEDLWRGSELLQQLIADGEESIVRRDIDGGVHFCGDFRNVADMHLALDVLEADPAYSQLVQRDRSLLDEMFEQTFHHDRFTGRSGTFFAYEGLGSIYWHMVSKLCLATIENYMWAKEASSDAAVLQRLHAHYRSIRDGLGLTKSPQQYGAFPSDPYSHTPEGAGVQQPGMTGQVKEDIIARYAELGVRISDGALNFDPCLFEASECLESASVFEFFDSRNELVKLPLSAGSFAYTICQVPVIYRQAAKRMLVLNYVNREPVRRNDLSLTSSETRSVFLRDGQIASIEVHFDVDSCS